MNDEELEKEMSDEMYNLVKNSMLLIFSSTEETMPDTALESLKKCYMQGIKYGIKISETAIDKAENELKKNTIGLN